MTRHGAALPARRGLLDRLDLDGLPEGRGSLLDGQADELALDRDRHGHQSSGDGFPAEATMQPPAISWLGGQQL